MRDQRARFVRFQRAIAKADWPAAMRIADDLIAGGSNNASLHYNRGLVLKHLDRLSEAIAAFETALQYDPDHAHAQFERAAALFNLGHLEEAVSAFGRYVETSPNDADAALNLGLALLRLGRADEAHSSLRAAHELAGSNETALALATVERDLGHIDEQERLMAGLDPTSPDLAAAALKIRTQGAKGRLSLRPA